MRSIARTLLLTFVAAGAVACGDSDSQPENVVEAAREDGRFTTLVGALEATGLDVTLGGDGPFTVFAPTDAAFALLPAGLVPGLGNAELSQILLYHVVGDEYREADVVALDAAPTLQGDDLAIQVIDGGVVLDGRVQIETTDIVTGNGVVHVIDAVLLPGEFPGTVVDALLASPRFSTLAGAVAGQGLAGTLSTANGGNGFTVLAPSNEAFDRLPGTLVVDLAAAGSLDDVLLYHVIGLEADAAAVVAADGMNVPTLATDPNNGNAAFEVAVDLDADGDLYLDGRTEVTYTDIVASNGIIHVLDSVLVPGGDFPGSVVEALLAYPRFKSLTDAVVAESLVGAVTDVTVFAPTNDAFASANLMGQPLSSVLPYHLLDDVLDSGSLMAAETTLQGADIAIDASMGVVINGTSNVIRADIDADDGIIHVIDAVLVPPAP